ncbi:MAG: hypothetical protein DMF89_15710 [Acidobacteria bacterium]|nr:MAG: hypothetical protein DMF90_13730 [Acidobacteriota bacterium]PYR48445.1 MAG: hypothetical protein DMF89_15710 [Acidobacteriota bacterium]
MQIFYRNSKDPLTYYELWDAFEERLVATCNDVFSVMKAGAFCNINEGDVGVVGCNVCQRFVKERMTR